MPNAADREEWEECSSYGTGESEQEVALEKHVNNDGAAWVDRVEDMQCSIAALDATQNVIVDKLAALEKLVTCVHEDMTWVRGDMLVVHEIVEKLAEYVSTLSNNGTTAEGVPEQRSPSVSPWGTWKDDAHGKAVEGAETTRIAEDEGNHMEDEDHSDMQVGRDADSAIRETQMFDINNSMHGNITSLAEEGDGFERYENRERGRIISPRRGQKTRRDEEEDAIDLGSDQMEMTMGGTQSGTEGPGRSIWTEFASTMKDIRGPVVGGGETSEGWVQSKRGRGSTTERGGRESTETLAPQMSSRSSLNLNDPPDNVGRGDGMSGRGLNAASIGRGSCGRAGGRASGRGAGRGKRPPPVQPRYRSMASF